MPEVPPPDTFRFKRAGRRNYLIGRAMAVQRDRIIEHGAGVKLLTCCSSNPDLLQETLSFFWASLRFFSSSSRKWDLT